MGLWVSVWVKHGRGKGLGSDTHTGAVHNGYNGPGRGKGLGSDRGGAEDLCAICLRLRQGFEFPVSSFGFRVSGFGFRV